MTPREATLVLAWPLWAVAEVCCWLLTRHKRWSDGTTGTVRVKWEQTSDEREAIPGLTDAWWITTGPLSGDYEKVLGPFVTKDLALEVRWYVETVKAPESYWLVVDLAGDSERSAG